MVTPCDDDDAREKQQKKIKICFESLSQFKSHCPMIKMWYHPTQNCEPVRMPVIRHTDPFFTNQHDLSYDSAYESKSDSESSNSSLDVGSNESVSPVRSPVPARSVRCRWTQCGQSFAQLDELAAHVTSLHAHTGPGGLFFCGWEGCSRGQRGFNARYKMLVHVRTHTNEKPHHCFQCDKSFSRAENLKIHARSHTGERPYVCPVAGCGKAYSNSSDRFKHTRTHSVDKPYTCKVPGCGKRYTDPSSLRKHVKTYRHFRAAPAPETDDSGKELRFIHAATGPDTDEHEQIVPEADEGFYSPVTGFVGSWLGSDLVQGMQWEQAKWPQPHWQHSDDLPLDLRVHK